MSVLEQAGESKTRSPLPDSSLAKE
jgi:hypothetical protein